MTENRCIEVLKKMKHMFTETCAKIDENTALDMAVEAIKEVQQYRAMEQRLQNIYGECDGLLETVVQHLENHENIKLPDNIIKARLLTDEDVDKWEGYQAIGTVEDVAFYKKCYDEESYEYCGEYGTDNCGCKDRMEHLEKKIAEYEAIGTIEEFKALKEKSVAKKPHSISIANDIGNSMVECPICHARSDYDVKSIKRGYCWKCGQKLDWSE